MHPSMPPLNALRAFEAAARHLSLTKGARELNVTASALSHQIKALEDHLGLKLFERRDRTIVLTDAGKRLYPGLQAGFLHLREAVIGLNPATNDHVLVVSTPPGFTAKWLAPRLYRFGLRHPEFDVRISSSAGYVNFATDGVDVAVRNLPATESDDGPLEIHRLFETHWIPVCTPRFVAEHGPFPDAASLLKVALIHDESLAGRARSASWEQWFDALGVERVAPIRGIRFSGADHALEAAGEGSGVLLAHDMLAYDDLRTGRLVVPVRVAVPTGRAFNVAWPRSPRVRASVKAFGDWILDEVAQLDLRHIEMQRVHP